MIVCVCGWNGMKMNVMYIEEYIVLWSWDDEYIVFKDIDIIQVNSAIWDGKEDWAWW